MNIRLLWGLILFFTFSMRCISIASAENMLHPGWVINEDGPFTELHRPDFPEFRIFSLGVIAPYGAEDKTAHLSHFDAMKRQWEGSPRCKGLVDAKTIEHRGGLVEAWSSPEAPKCRIMGLNMAPLGFLGVIIWHPDGLDKNDSAFKATTEAALSTLWDASYQISGQSGPYRGDVLALSDPMRNREGPIDFLIMTLRVSNDVITRALPIYEDGKLWTCNHWDPSFLDKNSQFLLRSDNCITLGIKGEGDTLSIAVQSGEELSWGPATSQLQKVFTGNGKRKVVVIDARTKIAKPFLQSTFNYQTEGEDMTSYLAEEAYQKLLYGWLVMSESGTFATGKLSALSHGRSNKSLKALGRYKFDNYHVRTQLSTGEKYIGLAAWWDDDPTKVKPDKKSSIMMFGATFEPCEWKCED